MMSSKISVTWLKDACEVRNKSVRFHLRRPFEQFLLMSKRTKVFWVMKAKEAYLANFCQ